MEAPDTVVSRSRRVPMRRPSSVGRPPAWSPSRHLATHDAAAVVQSFLPAGSPPCPQGSDIPERLALAGFVDAHGPADDGAPPVRVDSPAPAPQARETARPPEQSSPQVVGQARRLRTMPPWKVFRRGSQDSGAPLPVSGAPALPGSAASAPMPAAPSGS